MAAKSPRSSARVGGIFTATTLGEMIWTRRVTSSETMSKYGPHVNLPTWTTYSCPISGLTPGGLLLQKHVPLIVIAKR
jgi:hypothetical protein